MAVEWLLAYLALGAVVGFFAGLLGVGGGGIMVPILTSFFLAQNFGAESVHLALATSMASIVLTSVSSIRSHHRHGAILWPVVWQLSPAIVIGTLMAALLAGLLSSLFLAIFFCCFMTYVAVQMLLNIKPSASRQLPGWFGMSLTGWLIGAVSALVAIGGGSLTVPFLSYCNVRMQKAVATSAACGVPIALFGAIGNIAGGWHHTDLPAHATGFVYWPAVLGIALASTPAARLGAQLAHRLPAEKLKRLFALFVAAVGSYLIFKIAVLS